MVEKQLKKEYSTKYKACILQYIKEHEQQRFSAYDIYSYMESKENKPNLTTVYRNLDKLMENGTLLKYKSAEDDCCLYQYVKPHANCHEHLHLQCSKCGKVIHLECEFMNEVKAHLLEHHGFLLECSNSSLSGICEECRNEM